jgi:hypothetical protein
MVAYEMNKISVIESFFLWMMLEIKIGAGGN